MAEVELYHKIPGYPSAGKHGAYEDPLNYIFSHHVDVRAEIISQATARTGIAESALAAHRKTGASVIVTDEGAVDYTVWLEDRSDVPAAQAIESGGGNGRGGIGALHRAFPEAFA